MDAFISHSSADVTVAGRIEKRLEQAGLKIWLDRSEIRPGRLLRTELQSAIRDSRAVVLVWSKPAAKSSWVAAEILTAFHTGRFIVVCSRDKTPAPYFLQNSIRINVQPGKRGWLALLERAIRDAPAAANDLPPRFGMQTPQLQTAIETLARGQMEVTNRVGSDLAAARKFQKVVERGLKAAQKKWPLEAMILNLAGYHYKNAYMVKHWPAIMAGRPPKDALLERAERRFYESLFVDPNDYSALNGLGSILFYERELDAAEFFIRRALMLAGKVGVPYPAAEHDLRMVLAIKARTAAGPVG